MIYLLDTHTWIWWNMNPEKLSKRVKKIIGQAGKYDEMLLSAISPWEFSKLIEKKDWEFRAARKTGYVLRLICPSSGWFHSRLSCHTVQRYCPHLSIMIRLIRLSLPRQEKKMP